jgi:hypothetical protein
VYPDPVEVNFSIGSVAMFAHIGPEALLASFALLLGVACPQLGTRWFERLERALAAIARRRSLSVLICGLSALAMRLAVLPWLPVPKPFINDEFSFLLAGDTFAHGRLTNPTHPMWVHLETFHVIFRPTYASMYPPLQGLMLAFGQVFLGHPFWGMWLSAGLMCAAICWMLQAWLPPSWALLGGMLPVFRFGVFSYWDNGYWGGTLAATGGALLLGAVPRIMRSPRIRDAILLAIGITMLANTRPYEGFVLSLFVAGRLAWWAVESQITRRTMLTEVSTKQIPARRLIHRVVIPILVVLVLGAAATSYYFWRVTGNPLTMPQQVNRETYAVARYFYLQAAYPQPAYRHKVIHDFYTRTEFEHFELAQTIGGVLRQLGTKIALIWVFYIAPVLTLPLFLLHRVLHDRRVRFLVIAGAVGLASSAVVLFFNIHYVAAVASILLALIVQGMRHLRTWRWDNKPIGQFLVRSTVVMCVVMIPVQVHILSASPAPGSWAAIGPERVALEQQLRSVPGPHLVLVRYRPDHDPLLDWVYNGADIDRQNVVWARDMGPEANEELLRYYSKRRVWLLQPDDVPANLMPYTNHAVVVDVRAEEQH